MAQPKDPARRTLAAFHTPSTHYLTEAITDDLAAAGLAVYDDDFYEQLRVYRRIPAEAVTRRQLEGIVREKALVLMDRLAENPDARDGARRIARETAERIREGIKGTTSYVRHLTDIVVDSLPELEDAEVKEIRAAIAASKPRPVPRPPKSRAAYMADYRAAKQHAAMVRTADVLHKWLDKHVVPGDYDAADLWTRWQADILPRAAVKAPELHRVGRNAWYTLLEADPAVTIRISHRRRIVRVRA